ncbi:MAG: heme-binding protein [Acidobacteria bacterium]|nr:heme-binding protein [Acidobacteriota bacterium]
MTTSPSTLGTLCLAALLFALAGSPAMAYESNYPPTEVGVIEVKELPAARVMESAGGADYFEARNGPFMVLFDYIREHDLAMTVPVEADPRPARMRFFVERDHAGAPTRARTTKRGSRRSVPGWPSTRSTRPRANPTRSTGTGPTSRGS